MSLEAIKLKTSKQELPNIKLPLLQAVADTKANIIVTGSGYKLKEVMENLAQTSIRVDYFENCNDMIYTADASTVAAIFVQPVSSADIRQAISRFKEKVAYESLPVFAVTPLGTSNTKVRELYKAGASDVFQSVARSNKLTSLILAHQNNDHAGLGLTKQDKRLSNAITARLKVLLSIDRQIRVLVRNGKAYLMGKIDTLRDKKKIENIVSSTPGVGDIEANKVVIPHNLQSDHHLTLTIQNKLGRKPTIKDGAISVCCQDGVVTLSGTVASKRELRRVLEIAGQTEGIKSLENLLSISEIQATKDNSLAKKAQNLISGFFIASPIRISIVNNKAFLSGRVDLLGKRRLVENVVRRNFQPIDQIVNNIQAR